jgi:predicted amidophosphoribosyltransferase
MFTQSKSIATKLAEKSSQITDIFTRTVSDLAQINNEASEQIEVLEGELNSLKTTHSKNKLVIDKITEFFTS